MANNKVELSDGTVLLDLTADTVTADAVIAGRSLHLANGESATGTLEFPVTSVNSKTGAVSLTASDVGAAATSHTHTIANVTNLQTTLDGKQATVTGAATTITSSNLTANRALIANSSGKVVVSDVTSTELSYLDGVTSNIQTQLNKKIESAPVTSVNSKTGAVTISASDISAVPTSRTVNGKALSANISLGASDVSAVPTSRTVNGKALSANISLSASDVSAVPTSRTVNGKALSANISLAASDIGALSAAAGSVERANLAANATESETIFNSSTSFSSLVSYRGKTLALNAGSSSNVSITVAGADTAYATGFEVAILPQDVQSATIRFTSGTICAAGLTGVLDASSSAVELTLEKYVAIGLKKLNSGLWFITGEWENYEDTTKGEKGMIYVMSGGGNGCMLEVTGENAGDSLLVVNSQLGKSYSRTFNSNKIVKINGMQSGDWALTMTSKDGTQTKSATIHIDADYSLTMAYFSATINVTYPEGSTCTATDGTTTLSAPDTSGTWACIVPSAGTWTVTATNGTDTATKTVTITAEGQVETIELNYRFYIFRNGAFEGDYVFAYKNGLTGITDGVISCTQQLQVGPSVDVTKFSTLVFLVNSISSSTKSHFGVSAHSAPTNWNTDYSSEIINTTVITEQTTISVPLESISGEQYITVYGYGSTILIAEIYLVP